jgi:hypothetical protein
MTIVVFFASMGALFLFGGGLMGFSRSGWSSGKGLAWLLGACAGLWLAYRAYVVAVVLPLKYALAASMLGLLVAAILLLLLIARFRHRGNP